MPRGRRPGVPNRNFPTLSLERALELPGAISEGASGMPTDRLTVSELVDRSPSSSGFVNLVLASRAYGLTSGGKNADEFALTAVGRLAVSDDRSEQIEGRRKAVMSVEPFNAFLTAYDKKKVPQAVAFRSFLTGQAGVHAEHAQQCMAQLLEDARLAGFLRKVKGSEYVDLQGGVPVESPLLAEDEEDEADELGGDEDGAEAAGFEERLPQDRGRGRTTVAPPGSGTPPKRPSAIFVGHGRNKKPLEQLTKILEEYKIPYKVAVDEPNQGRPISQKVADVMDQCGSAILIFTADQEFEDSTGKTLWRPSENVVYELGAAAVKYGSRIIIFKEEAVDFPTNFRDIGHIPFAKDQLESKGMELFRELISFGLVTFSIPE